MIVALPAPLCADDTVSQDALLLAVHVHAGAVASVVLPLAPDAGTEAEVVPSEYAQPDAWFTMNARPPTLIVPERAGPVFAPYEYPSEPLPDALAPTATHAALLAAFHAQPVWVVIPIVPLPVPDDTEALAGDNA